MGTITILKIVDNDISYDNRIMDTFLVVDATDEQIRKYQEFVRNRFQRENWDYTEIIDYVHKYFTVLKHNEVEIEY